MVAPARSGEGRLSERTPAVQPRRRERVKVPLSRHSQRRLRSAESVVRTMVENIPHIATDYLSSHTSYRRDPLKMLLTMTTWSLT